jgi:hypothetical protein
MHTRAHHGAPLECMLAPTTARLSNACVRPPRRAPSPQVLFRPLAELCITAAVCNIIDAKEARDISKSGHPDMVMLTQVDEDAVVGAAVPSPPVKAASDKAATCERGVAGEYVGERNAAGECEGRGKVVFANGDVYEGEWKAGKIEGRGIYRSADGNVYEGEFKANKQEGRGIERYAHGDVYEGEFKAGEKEGRGIERYADGEVYEGEWKAGEKDGQGTYLYADGDIDVGFFKAGIDVGEGVRWTADGRSARQLQDGEVVKTISLEEAERRVERLGLPMPVRREGKWAAGQRGRGLTAGWFGILSA